MRNVNTTNNGLKSSRRQFLSNSRELQINIFTIKKAIP